MVKPYNTGSSAIYENSNLNQKSGKTKTIPIKSASILRSTKLNRDEMANDTNVSATVTISTSTINATTNTSSNATSTTGELIYSRSDSLN